MGEKRNKLTTKPGIQGFVIKEERTTKVISFKVTDTEDEAITKYIKKLDKKSRSEFIRQAIFYSIENKCK